jgi:hypothetical protein
MCKHVGEPSHVDFAPPEGGKEWMLVGWDERVGIRPYQRGSGLAAGGRYLIILGDD